MRKLWTKLTKFSVVGGSGVLVNTVALYLLYQIGHLPLLVASAFAVELAVVNNFLWNNVWTFGQHDLSLERFARFNLASIGGMLIAMGTLYLLSNLGIYYLLANLAGIAVATVWNFSLSMLWTWRLEA